MARFIVVAALLLAVVACSLAMPLRPVHTPTASNPGTIVMVRARVLLVVHTSAIGSSLLHSLSVSCIRLFSVAFPSFQQTLGYWCVRWRVSLVIPRSPYPPTLYLYTLLPHPPTTPSYTL